MLRTEVQQDRPALQPQIADVREKIGLQVEHFLLDMPDGIAGRELIVVNQVLNRLIFVADGKFQAGLARKFKQPLGRLVVQPIIKKIGRPIPIHDHPIDS